MLAPDLEQRLIRKFAKDRSTHEVWLMAELEILLIYLLEDGLLEDTAKTRTTKKGPAAFLILHTSPLAAGPRIGLWGNTFYFCPNANENPNSTFTVFTVNRVSPTVGPIASRMPLPTE